MVEHPEPADPASVDMSPMLRFRLDAKAAIAEIRELHKRTCEISGEYCSKPCPASFCVTCDNTEWPCPTVAILERHGL